MRYGGDKYGQDQYGSTLYITPDLGWSSVDAMLDPAQNPAAVLVAASQMTATANTFTGYIGPQSRVLQFSGGNRQIAALAIRSLFGNGIRHYYRRGILGDIGTFVLQLGTSGVE